MKSSSQHTFAQVPSVEIPRSSFKRNFTYKTTMDAGYLVPIYCDEVLPGDTFNFKLTSFARVLSPLKYPIMDNLYMDFQFFFVPVRLVYDDYEKFFGSSKGREGKWEFDDSHLMPVVNSGSGFAVGSIADYFGIPTGVPDLDVLALPFRAYNLIVADWYLPSSYGLESPEVKTDSSDDSSAIYSLVKRMKRCDYFTSALPSPQRGSGVEISLSGSVPVLSGEEISGVSSANLSNNHLRPVAGTPLAFTSAGEVGYKSQTGAGKTGSLMSVDLGSATAIPINDLRQAFQLQRALERDMRGGVMYRDQLMSHFGVRSPDARLQRSEYLGGGSTPIQIHAVANTAGSADGNSQGSLAAYGVSGQSGVGFVKSFVEHGYVIGLASVRADVTYQQGLSRMFMRRARFDFYYPVFAHLGEQVVKNKEIFAQGSSVKDSNGNVVDEQPFGYQERFAEYRYGVSKITGQLRSTFAQPLDSWHLAQKFNNLPVLNREFLEENVPMSRVEAVTDGPDFLFDSLVSLNCVRPMPLFGVPGLVDHF